MTVLYNPTLSQMDDAIEYSEDAAMSDFDNAALDALKHDDMSTLQADYIIEGDIPTLSEMRHYLEVRDALAHYGIKGMKWGIRRSDRQLAALRNEDGEEIGGIRTRTRADAKTLKGMKAGQAVVIESEDGPMAVVKTKDGAFKQVHISADAQNAVRTLNKEQVEMSTREIKEAAARAKAIEDYNKYFGPKDDANADLQAAVDRLQLEQKYSAAYSSLNPTKIERAANFVSKAAPIYDTYAKINKASGGQLNTSMVEVVNMIRGTSSKPATAAGVAAKVSKQYGAKRKMSVKTKTGAKVGSISKKGP